LMKGDHFIYFVPLLKGLCCFFTTQFDVMGHSFTAEESRSVLMPTHCSPDSKADFLGWRLLSKLLPYMQKCLQISTTVISIKLIYIKQGQKQTRSENAEICHANFYSQKHHKNYCNIHISDFTSQFFCLYYNTIMSYF
jgi:hypothetical protein